MGIGTGAADYQMPQRNYAEGSSAKRTAYGRESVTEKKTGGSAEKVSEEEFGTIAGVSGSIRQAAGSSESGILGLTTIPGKGNMSYGVIAKYAEDSTENDPIIRVSTYEDGERVSYDIHVNQVNPENATQFEMFALCCYMDDKGITDGGTFGSYTRLRECAYDAAQEGSFADLLNAANVDKKLNWLSMLKDMSAKYLESPVSYALGLSGKALAAALEKRIEGKTFAKDAVKNNAEKIQESQAVRNTDSRVTVDNEFYQITKGDNNTVKIYDKTTGYSYTLLEDYLSIQTDEKTGKRFLISDIPYTTMNVEAMELNDRLKQSILEYRNGTAITEKTLDKKFSVYTDALTGIPSLHWRSGDGMAACMMISTAAQKEKFEELADIYLKSYPNLVSDGRAAEIRASWEIKGYARRTSGGILSISGNAVTYDDNEDYRADSVNFSHCWSYRFHEKINEAGYEDFIKELREYIHAADENDLKDEKVFRSGFAKYQQENPEAEEMDYRQFIRDYIYQVYEKLQSGDTEPSYRIGAQSFTIKEWEKLLEEFDAAEEAIKESIEEEIEKRAEAARRTEIETDVKAEKEMTEQAAEAAGKIEHTEKTQNVQMDMLLSDTVQARFSTGQVNSDGTPVEDIYLIAMDRYGIRCSRPGMDSYEWEIVFTDESQYKRAAELMSRAGESMDNFRFAAHENFWKDYLEGKIDVNAFLDFLKGTDNGVPNYGIGDETQMRIDESKIRWAQYMNPLSTKFYTAEEFAKMLAETIEENKSHHTKLSDIGAYTAEYRRQHPEYRGEAIFRLNNDGKYYTAYEIGRMLYEEAMQYYDPDITAKRLGLGA